MNAAGCKGTVTAEMLQAASEGFHDIIKKMTEEFDEVSQTFVRQLNPSSHYCLLK